jgi:hypothetical protein
MEIFEGEGPNRFEELKAMMVRLQMHELLTLPLLMLAASFTEKSQSWYFS